MTGGSGVSVGERERVGGLRGLPGGLAGLEPGLGWFGLVGPVS